MAARSTPEDGDVVVREGRREGQDVYVMHVAPGADQYVLRSRTDAVTHAVTVAKRECVRAWLTDGGYHFTLLEDFRAAIEKGAMPHKTLLERIRGEYLEMPGLRLTLEQAQRLCGVERALCQRVLDTLVEMSFLCVKPNGIYGRVHDGADHPHPHTAPLS